METMGIDCPNSDCGKEIQADPWGTNQTCPECNCVFDMIYDEVYDPDSGEEDCYYWPTLVKTKED